MDGTFDAVLTIRMWYDLFEYALLNLIIKSVTKYCA